MLHACKASHRLNRLAVNLSWVEPSYMTLRMASSLETTMDQFLDMELKPDNLSVSCPRSLLSCCQDTCCLLSHIMSIVVYMLHESHHCYAYTAALLTILTIPGGLQSCSTWYLQVWPTQACPALHYRRYGCDSTMRKWSATINHVNLKLHSSFVIRQLHQLRQLSRLSRLSSLLLLIPLGLPLLRLWVTF